MVFKKNNISNIESLERRKHWRERRATDDRRNPTRLTMATYECRNDSPRRSSDRGGELSEGEIWWQVNANKDE